MSRYTTILSIAGSDSIGGAGIQADIKTACHFGVYAMTAVTAVTVQNTLGVTDFQTMSASIVAAQIDSIVGDVRPDAVKIGMLPDVDVIHAVADALQRHGLRHVVLDPVMVATSGDALTRGDSTVHALVERLIPLAEVVTPNVPEAEVLLGRQLQDLDEDARLIGHLAGRPVNVVLKGGHLADDALYCTDRLYLSDSDEVRTVSSDCVKTRNTHGTGCSLSSAIACGLAHGESVYTAVMNAKMFISRAIAQGADYEFGHGHGPICFF